MFQDTSNVPELYDYITKPVCGFRLECLLWLKAWGAYDCELKHWTWNFRRQFCSGFMARICVIFKPKNLFPKRNFHSNFKVLSYLLHLFIVSLEAKMKMSTIYPQFQNFFLNVEYWLLCWILFGLKLKCSNLVSITMALVFGLNEISYLQTESLKSNWIFCLYWSKDTNPQDEIVKCVKFNQKIKWISRVALTCYQNVVIGSAGENGLSWTLMHFAIDIV